MKKRPIVGRRKFLKTGTAAAAAAAAACSDKRETVVSSVVGPDLVPESTVGETILTVLGGSDGSPLRGILVEVADESYWTDSAGQVRLAGAAGELANISAPGHISPRTVRIARGIQEANLWYLHGVSPQYVRNLVYKAWDRNVTYPLLRVPTGTVVCALLSEKLRRDDAAVAAWENAVAEANRLARALGISFELFASGRVPRGVVSFEVSVNPSDPNVRGARAVTYRNRDSKNWITGGSIVYGHLDYARLPDVAAHELGHAGGLMHSYDPRDLMAVAHIAEGFSENELRVAEAMAMRLAGNTWTDTDPGASPPAPAAVLGERRVVTIC